MTESEIFETVKELVAEKLKLEPSEVTPEKSFTGDLGADSLDTAQLIMDLEDKFDLEIPDEEAEKLQTVGAVIEYVKTKQNG